MNMIFGDDPFTWKEVHHRQNNDFPKIIAIKTPSIFCLYVFTYSKRLNLK